MTEKERQLLLKDLCARLPYGVIIKSISGDDYGPAIDICYPQGVVAYMGQKMDAYTEEFLPYLRPLSSMTAEEENFYYSCLDEMDGYKQTFPVIYQDKALSLLDFLNAHHFDYRGLIEKGMALEAPEGMYSV